MIRILSFLCVLSTSLFAESIKVDLSKASKISVEFKAIGNPSALIIEGKSEKLEGVLEKNGDAFKGEASLTLETLETGLSLRDDHMKNKYLEIAKYPKTTLKLTSLSWGKGDFKDLQGQFKGQLTLHGVTKDISGKTKLSKDAKTVEGDVEFTIDLTDYKIEIPSFMEITVAKTVDVHVAFSAPWSAQ